MGEIYEENYTKLIVPLGDVYRYFNGNEYLFIYYPYDNVNDKPGDIISGFTLSIHPFLQNMWKAND